LQARALSIALGKREAQLYDGIMIDQKGLPIFMLLSFERSVC